MKDYLSGFLYRLRTIDPVRFVVLGYMTYILVGFVLLCAPFMHINPVLPLDNLFIATSAVSTTGLATVTVCDGYNFWGQLVILTLIQLGGIGYMTFSSFVILSTRKNLDDRSKSIAHVVFGIPKGFRIEKFIISVIGFSFAIELFGAVGLFFVFSRAGVENPVWQAVFHSVSAFCTAGFSLLPTSFEGLAGNVWLNVVISVLSIIGAMGFIVCVDIWHLILGKEKHVTLTTKVIISITFWLIVVGSALMFLTETYGGGVAPDNRIMFSFFQAMTAQTTVGFNTVALSAMSKSSVMLLCILMIIGASPSGTGGGLKTTTFSVMWGLIKSAVKGEEGVRILGANVPEDRVKTAMASLGLYVSTLAVGTYFLTLTEPGSFLDIFFEAASALGTVGLSMGITPGLGVLGKIVIIIMMYIGRVGPLTFGTALYVKPELIFDDEKTDLVV